MEELTHSLLENGYIEKKDAQYVLSRRPSEIPETIQGIIAARIDRLEDSLKKVIQVAAVIGIGMELTRFGIGVCFRYVPIWMDLIRFWLAIVAHRVVR